LNGADFGTCIRCGSGLGKAEPADRAARRVPAPRRRVAMPGRGSEPLFGRYPAEALPVARLLVFMNMGVYVFQVAGALRHMPAGEALIGGGQPVDAFAFGALLALETQLLVTELWRVLAACFVHFGAIHLAMNMFGLIALARSCEPKLGSVRFLLGYVASGIGGFLVWFAWTALRNDPGITAGASGAVFGIEGMMVGALLRERDPAWKQWLGYAAGSLLLVAFLPYINNAAHLGGLVTGIGFGWLFGRGAPQPSRPWQRWAAALFLIASVASVVASRVSPNTAEALETVRAQGGES
jgi:rhomboid protease GluP